MQTELVADVLHKIFEYQDYKTLLKMESVSKSWKHLVRSNPSLFHFKTPIKFFQASLLRYNHSYQIKDLLYEDNGVKIKKGVYRYHYGRGGEHFIERRK
jgi:hypothetical protein